MGQGPHPPPDRGPSRAPPPGQHGTEAIRIGGLERHQRTDRSSARFHRGRPRQRTDCLCGELPQIADTSVSRGDYIQMYVITIKLFRSFGRLRLRSFGGRRKSPQGVASCERICYNFAHRNCCICPHPVAPLLAHFTTLQRAQKPPARQHGCEVVSH